MPKFKQKIKYEITQKVENNVQKLQKYIPLKNEKQIEKGLGKIINDVCLSEDVPMWYNNNISGRIEKGIIKKIWEDEYGGKQFLLVFPMEHAKKTFHENEIGELIFYDYTEALDKFVKREKRRRRLHLRFFTKPMF